MSRTIRVINWTHKIASPAQVVFCESFLCRLRGLMFQSGLPQDEGLLLVGEQDSRLEAAIHMLFVPFDLSIFWINAKLEIVDKIIAKSWHLAYTPKSAAMYILEMHPDRLGDYQIGDQVEFVNIESNS